jgi:hypothetical protein
VADLTFACVGASADPYAVAPTLAFRLSITSTAPVHSIALRCQIRIEPAKRRYSAEEAQTLHDLFGEPSRWADTLKPVQFAMVNVMVPTFDATTETDLVVPCTYDLEIAATRYFHGLREGEIPLLMLFSGTVLGGGPGRLLVEPVPWSAECSYRMPVAVWRQMVDRHFPNSGWLRLSRDTLDELGRYKSRNALPTWEAAILDLLGGRATDLGVGQDGH